MSLHPDRILSSAEGPASRYLGPNWFASVMGTGIVANAGALLPYDVPGLAVWSRVVWLLAALLLAVLLAATALHWVRSPHVARTYGRDVQMSQYYGAPPMALLTVGTGSLLVGGAFFGARASVDLDWVLWSLGTASGLVSAVVIPYRLFTQISVRPDAAFGGWLMPVVPPMVSAAAGALLVPHVASATGRATLVYACFALFGMSLMAAFIIITLIWSRLAYFGSSQSGRVPTLWIVLGPLGQSITAAGSLGAVAPLAVSPDLARAMSDFSVLYGVPVWGFAMLWTVLAAALTLRTARRHLPFSLTWWSFTFPVGVTVTGTIRLARETGLPAFAVASAVGYALLVGAWVLVATRTWWESRRGSLLNAPPPGASAPPARKDS
jgi:C4-dicarboxylate transporter/malic acid transport protein